MIVSPHLDREKLSLNSAKSVSQRCYDPRWRFFFGRRKKKQLSRAKKNEEERVKQRRDVRAGALLRGRERERERERDSERRVY